MLHARQSGFYPCVHTPIHVACNVARVKYPLHGPDHQNTGLRPAIRFRMPLNKFAAFTARAARDPLPLSIGWFS